MSGAAPEHVLEVEHLDARRFELAIKRLADGLAYGLDRSPFVGSGIEWAQSRPYQPGDPVRSIDWRVTARTRRVHVKEYEAPKRLPCWLLVDTSASMTARSGPRSKYALAVQVAGAVALASLQRLAPVGLLGTGERTLRADPSLGREQVLLWLHRLRRYRLDEATTLSRRLLELAPSLSERSLVLCLSDLHDPGALDALERLALQHDVAVIHFLDPAELGVPGAGFARAREAESQAGFVGRLSRPATDPAAVAQRLRRHGIDHLLLRTDQELVQRLRHFLRSRNLLGRGAR